MARIGMLVIVLLATFAAACATQTKNFRLESVGGDEGVLIGNVKIAYNGGPANSKNCQVCFNSMSGQPCLKLDESGDVFLPIKVGKTTLHGIWCLDVSAYHYWLTGAEFEVGPHGTKTYFGHVSFEWQTHGGMKASDFFGLIGNVIDLSSNDGVLRMTVSDQVEQSIAAFEKQVGETDSLTLKKSIVSVGH